MLTVMDVVDIFADHVPQDTTIKVVATDEFIASALRNPFIQKQVEIGIYDLDTIATDFLSAACSYSQMKRLEICYDLIVNHCEGVTDDDLIYSYVLMMAIHESHHFHVNHAPRGFQEHAEAEVMCLQEVLETHPDLSSKVKQFEAQSLTYQRVYKRMRSTFQRTF